MKWLRVSLISLGIALGIVLFWAILEPLEFLVAMFMLLVTGMAVGVAILFKQQLFEPLVVLLSPLVGWLASRHLFFTKVYEGTCKIVVEGGAFRRALIQWEGHTFDYAKHMPEKWGVIEGDEPWHPFGGRRWVGAPWRFAVYGYKLRWSSPREDGTIVQHEEILTHVLLKDHIFYLKIEGVEDRDMVPVDFGFFLTMRCVNPWKFVFRVQDPLEMMMNRISPLFREYVGERGWEEIARLKRQASEAIWRVLRDNGLIDALREDYGIKIAEGSIQIRDITPRAEYQRVAALPYTAGREAQKTVIDGEARGRAFGLRIRALIRGLFSG